MTDHFKHNTYLAANELGMNAVVAEWLRRLTRNQIPSGSVGSNPTDCESLIFFSWVLLTLPLVNLGKAFLSNRHRWFSGRMAACHAVGPGSIPGRCIQLFLFVCLVGFVSFSHPFSLQKNGVENGSRNKRTRKVKKF